MKRVVVASMVLAVGLVAVLAGQAAWLQMRLVQAGGDGRMVDIGGRAIHLNCSGSGHPTYLLEAGAVGFADIWQWVRAGLQPDARVCAYDRAGLGASEANADGIAPESLRRDLKAALDAADERPPYVLVGHSLGGILVRSFAAAHPDDVQALVLVDPTHEDQIDRFDDVTAGHFETFRRMMKILPVAAKLGLLHIWNPLAAVASGLEGKALERALLYAQSPKCLAAAADELDAWTAIMDDRRRSPVPPSIPTLVISAGSVPGRSADMNQVMQDLHKKLAGQSVRGVHTVFAEADHFSILTDRRTAERLADVVRDFVKQAGAG